MRVRPSGCPVRKPAEPNPLFGFIMILIALYAVFWCATHDVQYELTGIPYVEQK